MLRALAIAVLLIACSRGRDETGSKQWQEQAPPRKVSVPANLVIAVDVDGAAQPPITSAQLQSTKPDFTDDEHQVWLIHKLVADVTPGSVVEATSPSGTSIKLAHPTAEGMEPGLFLTRRGELLVSVIDPRDPFPRWHGQGGRLHRAGDPQPKIPVAKVSITTTRPKP